MSNRADVEITFLDVPGRPWFVAELKSADEALALHDWLLNNVFSAQDRVKVQTFGPDGESSMSILKTTEPRDD